MNSSAQVLDNTQPVKVTSTSPIWREPARSGSRPVSAASSSALDMSAPSNSPASPHPTRSLHVRRPSRVERHEGTVESARQTLLRARLKERERFVEASHPGASPRRQSIILGDDILSTLEWKATVENLLMVVDGMVRHPAQIFYVLYGCPPLSPCG